MSVGEEQRTVEEKPHQKERAQPNEQARILALCGIAAYFRIAADPVHLKRELASPPARRCR